jgi:hypothetical protein
MNDDMRKYYAAIYEAWRVAHGDNPVTASTIDPAVLAAFKRPSPPSRQDMARWLQCLVDVEIGGRAIRKLPDVRGSKGRMVGCYRLESV